VQAHAREPIAHARPDRGRVLIRNSTSDGSTSPLRVPITRPSSGVKPIEVVNDSPPRIARAEQPFPRCKVMMLTSSGAMPASVA
jgi:hypothetical protein